LYVSSIFINSSLTCFSFCLRFYYPTVIAFSSFLHLSIDFVTRFTKLILCCLSRPRFWAFHFLYLIIFSFKTFLIKKVRNKLRLKHQWICKNKCFHPILKFQQFSDVCLKKRRSYFCPVIRSLGNLLFIKTSWGHADHYFLHETEYDRDNFNVNYDYCHISYM
jgi:hypothetical protein